MTQAPPREEPTEEPQDDETLPEAPARRGCLTFGCLWRVVAALAVAAVVAVIIGETLDQGPPDTPRNPDLNAGPAEEYARGDLSFFPSDNVYVVRLEDGSFIALYDKSSKQQEIGRDCRASFDESAQLTGLAQLPGFEGAFVEVCGDLRAVWRADGAFANGAGYGDLDRFETSIDDSGNLIVDLDRRTCTRSRGVAGQPPFDVRTCDRGD
jgi:hypothetical protein